MKLIRNENSDYHLVINGEIKTLQEFNITKEDCDILTLGYDVEKMATLNAHEIWCDKHTLENEQRELNGHILGYIEGFKAHKEIIKDMFFTIEDIKKAIRYGFDVGFCSNSLNKNKNNLQSEESFIKSISPKSEWNVEFYENYKLKLI